MASIFTKIIKGEIPSYKIYEDEKCIAFLDINPIQQYHTLVVPKNEIPYIFDLDDDTYTHLMLVCKKLSHILKKLSNAKKICIAVQGFDIEHTHIHLIPCNSGADFDFKKSHPATKEELESNYTNIVKELNKELNNENK